MAYDIDGLKKGGNAPGKTAETTDQASLPSGVYIHPETGAEQIVKAHPLFGNTQAEAAIRVGFVYDRPAKEGDVKTIVEQVLDAKAEKKTDSSDELVKGLAARLSAVEDKAAADQDELEQLRAEKAERESADADAALKAEEAEKAKAAAAAQAGKQTETKKKEETK